MPPIPTSATGPKAASRLEPMISSTPSDSGAIASTENSGGASRAVMSSNACASDSSSVIPTRTPPASDLCSSPSALRTTGYPMPSAAARASWSVPTRSASTNGTPAPASSSRAPKYDGWNATVSGSGSGGDPGGGWAARRAAMPAAAASIVR